MRNRRENLEFVLLLNVLRTTLPCLGTSLFSAATWLMELTIMEKRFLEATMEFQALLTAVSGELTLSKIA